MWQHHCPKRHQGAIWDADNFSGTVQGSYINLAPSCHWTVYQDRHAYSLFGLLCQTNSTLILSYFLHGLFSLTTACDTAKVRIVDIAIATRLSCATQRNDLVCSRVGLSPRSMMYINNYSAGSARGAFHGLSVPVVQTVLPDSMGSTQMKRFIALVACQGFI